jgi:hypothetical protein
MDSMVLMFVFVPVASAVVSVGAAIFCVFRVR